ncbi:MAG: hypothetical protein GTN76_07200, partial [Candidatus Aenigmarchaeota archaeon]|nr:hypothetical protein [Candidatus Aenigmarchaeota archaeon]
MGKKIRRTRKKRFELFFNLNGGVYFVDIESTIAGISDKDSDQVYGLEAGLGGRYNFAKKFF